MSRRITLIELYQRDKGICYLCGRRCNRPVPKVQDQTPLAPTRDHVKPKAKGGGDSRRNVRLACNQCNNEKGSQYNSGIHVKHKGKL